MPQKDFSISMLYTKGKETDEGYIIVPINYSIIEVCFKSDNGNTVFALSTKGRRLLNKIATNLAKLNGYNKGRITFVNERNIS